MTANVTRPFSEHPISNRILETNNSQSFLVIPSRLVNSPPVWRFQIGLERQTG